MSQVYDYTHFTLILHVGSHFFRGSFRVIQRSHVASCVPIFDVLVQCDALRDNALRKNVHCDLIQNDYKIIMLIQPWDFYFTVFVFKFSTGITGYNLWLRYRTDLVEYAVMMSHKATHWRHRMRVDNNQCDHGATTTHFRYLFYTGSEEKTTCP